MVLSGQYQDLFSCLYKRGQAGSYQVDSLGGATGEKYLIGFGGIDMLLELLAGCLISFCSLLAEGMHPSVDIGIVGGIVLYYTIDYLLGLLTGGSIVKIY
jgi:hypothetical protein